MSDFVLTSSYCLGPAHFFHPHFSFRRSLKYSLLNEVGANCQGPSNPDRSVWHRPSE